MRPAVDGGERSTLLEPSLILLFSRGDACDDKVLLLSSIREMGPVPFMLLCTGEAADGRPSLLAVQEVIAVDVMALMPPDILIGADQVARASPPAACFQVYRGVALRSKVLPVALPKILIYSLRAKF